MSDILPDHDNAMKWKRWFASLSPGWKVVFAFVIAAACVGGIVSCNQHAQVASLRGELGTGQQERDAARNERDVANQKINQLNADFSPLKTAALMAYGKADPESLKKLADDLSTLRAAWSKAEEEAKLLRSEIRRVRAQTERAVDQGAEEELVSLLKTLPKPKVGIKRYEHTAEAVRFADQLETIFTKSGFTLTVHPPEVQGMNLAHLVGQLFQLNMTNQPPMVKRVFDALNAAGMNFTVVDQPGMSSNEIELAIFRLSK